MSEKKLSACKQLILKTLRNKKYVHFRELLGLTQQKHFDRRIRELKSEQGYDIEVEYINGDPHYILKSEKRKPKIKRTYLKKSEKDKLIDRAGSFCPICNKKFSKKYPKILDHKIPIIRGGDGSLKNFQIICHPCNNQKRSQCRGCNLNCKHCFLAFPEKYPESTVVSFNKHTNEVLDKICKLENISKTDLVRSIVEKKLT